MIDDYIQNKALIARKDKILLEIDAALEEGGVNLLVKDGLYTHNLGDYINAAKNGDLNKLRLYSILAFNHKQGTKLSSTALELLRILATSNNDLVSYHSKYNYAVCLIENSLNVSEGMGIINFLAEKKYAPAQCRLGVYQMLGFNGLDKNLVEAKKLFIEASGKGHLRSRIFLTRMKKKHGGWFDKLTWPFYMFKDILYAMRLGPYPDDETLLLY
jgi:TPR repeat protein